jgi:hypothetical protein
MPCPRSSSKKLRFTTWSVCALLFVFSWASADAAHPQGGINRKKTYSLPAEDASVSLRKFVEQSGEQIIYLENQIRGIKTNPVQGTLNVRDAIEQLVANTALMFVQDKETGALMIQRRDCQGKNSPVAPPATQN